MSRPSTDEAWIGQQIAERYRLDRIIGKGGMGTVYEAVHLWTGRPVAVKLLYSADSERMSKRILAEARAAAAVRHPHVVEVLDVGFAELGVMYLVLELLEGETLQSLLKRRAKLRAEDALDIIVPILDALEVLHQAQIAHRDVKPGNVFLSRGAGGRVVPKLLDLGISKRLDAAEGLTVTGALMGTPSYMAPEQARGADEVGASADIWAVGVLLFECLTGRRPFEHATIPGTLHLIATERPPPIATLVDDLPGALASAVDRALAYDPADRHASAGAMADALVDAALAAGWPLTCRIPAGPMISLVPEEPSGERRFDPSDRTPHSDDATPVGLRATTPIPGLAASVKVPELAPPSKAPRADDPAPRPRSDRPAGAEAAPAPDPGVRTRAVRRPSSDRPPSDANGKEIPGEAAVDDARERAAVAPAAPRPADGDDAAPADDAADASGPEVAPSARADEPEVAAPLPTLPVRSRGVWLALAACLALVAGVAYWFVGRAPSADPPAVAAPVSRPPVERAEEPPADRALPAAAAAGEARSAAPEPGRARSLRSRPSFPRVEAA
ncbi:MAG: serine/threonine protein kinase [Sandaracinaceae bacterium]|nr:serine/threonine protein kinase [Sandaracinaceae bacterium]